MEYLMENLWLFWVAVGIFFLIVECITTALVSIWFVAAAAITSVFSVFVDSFIFQFGIFLILSGVFMVLFRNVYRKHFKNGVGNNIKPEEQIIEKNGVTVEKTDAHGGKVLVGDVYWRAVTEDGSTIEKDETVVITGVNSTTLIIKSI